MYILFSWRRVFGAVCLVVGCQAVWAAQLVEPPSIASTAYLVADVQSGQILAQKSAGEHIEPASLAKLMTAYLSLQALSSGQLDPDQMLTVSDDGWRVAGSRLFMQPNTPVKAKTVLQGMLVTEGNDAAITLAEAIAGSQAKFVQQMNAEAQTLGMTQTHFVNCTGLPAEGQYTTAADLLKLTTALMQRFAPYQTWFTKKSFAYNQISQPNRNLLLYRDPSVDGMAVGYSLSGGYNLVASSKRNQRSVVAIVVGAESVESRAAAGSALLNWVLQSFDTVKLYEANHAVSAIKVYKGKRDEVAVGFLQTAYVSVPHGSVKKLRPVLETIQPVVAPIAQGRVLGTLRLFDGNRLVSEKSVVALETVPEAGWMGKTWDGFVLWLKNRFA